MDIQIKHDASRQRFYAVIDGKEAVLDYDKPSDKVLDYHHTFVPPELRGQQIAEKIVMFALKYAKDNHYKIVPTCPYVQRILQRHPEFNSIVL